MPGRAPANSLITCSGYPECTGTGPPASSYPPLPTSSPSASASSSSSSSRPTPAAAPQPGDASERSILHGFPTGPTTLVLPTGGASSSPSSSSHPPAAAMAPFPPGIDNLIPTLKHVVWSYLDSKAERGQLAFEGLMPREEGHLVLSYEMTGEMPLSARRIPPVDGSSSVLIPTNKMSFCTENTDSVIVAINSQWNSLNPWRLTVLTVRLRPVEIAGDMNKTMRILNGIKATLGHVKTLIVVMGRLSFFFTSTLSADPFLITVPESVCESNRVFLLKMLRIMMTVEFSTEGYFCDRVLDSCKNTEAAPSPLTGIIIELHDDATWDWYERTMAATGPTDPRLHLMVSIVESGEAGLGPFWGNPVKVGSLQWLSYFFYTEYEKNANELEPMRLDFSGCTRLFELFVQCLYSHFSSVHLPTNVDRLEKLSISLSEYTGAHISLGEGRIYPHLRQLCIPHFRPPPAVAPAAGAGAGGGVDAGAAAPVVGTSVLSVSSEQFPALQLFKSEDCGPDEVLDFSNFRASGLSINLVYFEGNIIMPDPKIQMDTLTLNGPSAIRLCSFDDILPRFLSLELSDLSARDFPRIFDRVNRLTPGTSKHPASAHLKKLVIREVRRSVIQFGAFPELQSLTLERTTVTLDGANFPLLEELNLDYSNLSVRNRFSALRSLNIKGGDIPKGFSINAPLLEKLSIVDTGGANNFVVERKTLPNLQLFTILPSHLLTHVLAHASSLYPRFILDPESENTKIITVFYEEGIPTDVIGKLEKGLGRVLLFPIQRVEQPLMDPFL